MIHDEKNSSENSHELRNDSTPNDAQSFDAQLKECHMLVQEWKDKYFRLTADFDNYKKRLEKDQVSWQRMLQTGILLDVIAIVDDFDRAFADPSLKKDTLPGFVLIYKNLQKLLDKYGVTEIKELGNFDPHYHEAVMNVPADEEHKSGTVVQVLQKGYTFKDHVLRPAKVSIAE